MSHNPPAVIYPMPRDVVTYSPLPVVIARGTLMYYNQADGYPPPGFACDRIEPNQGIFLPGLVLVVAVWVAVALAAPKIYARLRA